MDGKTLFFSPCHAGCQKSEKMNADGESMDFYSDCFCVKEKFNESNVNPLLAEWFEQIALEEYSEYSEYSEYIAEYISDKLASKEIQSMAFEVGFFGFESFKHKRIL